MAFPVKQRHAMALAAQIAVTAKTCQVSVARKSAEHTRATIQHAKQRLVWNLGLVVWAVDLA